MNAEVLIGKTIADISVDGDSVYIKTEDGLVFEYEAYDDGCSGWDIYKKEK